MNFKQFSYLLHAPKSNTLCLVSAVIIFFKHRVSSKQAQHFTCAGATMDIWSHSMYLFLNWSMWNLRKDISTTLRMGQISISSGRFSCLIWSRFHIILVSGEIRCSATPYLFLPLFLPLILLILYKLSSFQIILSVVCPSFFVGRLLAFVWSTIYW